MTTLDAYRVSKRRLNAAAIWLAMLGLAVAPLAAAQAEEAAAAPAAAAPASAPSVTELKAAAYDAQENARAAEAAASEAAAAAAEASAAAESTRRAVAESAGAATPSAAPPLEEWRMTDEQAAAATAPAVGVAPAAAATAAAAATETAAPAAATAATTTVDDLHRATEEAQNAAAAARAATAALEEHIREREARYSRNGLFLSGGVFFAPELFDTSIEIGDSRGVYGAIGYHFAERIELELRFDGIDDFAIGTPQEGLSGSFYGWSATLNGRVFLMTKSFQPYFGMGLGALIGKTRVTDLNTGTTYRWDDEVALFRVSAGFDYYVSETLALTADASINLPGGELSGANYATLGGGLKLRF